jgi:hypothetical protein
MDSLLFVSRLNIVWCGLMGNIEVLGLVSRSTVFVQTGYTPLQALYVSLGFGAVNFLFAIPALFTIDTCE